MPRPPLFLLLSLVLLSGAAAGEPRSVPPFSGVLVSGGLHATVHFGLPQRVSVSGPAQAEVVTEVKDGRLLVRWIDARSHSTAGLKIEIVSPKTEVLGASGGAELRAGEMAGESLQVRASGGSTVFADGQVRALQVEVSGGSTANLANLTAARVQLRMSGGARGRVKARQQVAGSLSGGSEIVVFGGPATREVRASGGSQVRYEEPRP